MIDSLFVVDIILNFRTTIRNDLTGEEIFDPKIIAANYVKRMFIPDLLATIPYDTLVSIGTSTELIGLFSMFKIVRITRFTKVIVYLNSTESVKLSLKLIKLIFYLCMYLHWQACAWFFYTKQDKTWFPLTEIIEGKDNIYDNPISYTYCFSLWHSVSILEGADMVPATDHQAVIVSFLVIVSEFIHAHILGTMGVVIQQLSRKSSKFQETIEFATSTMKTIKLN